MIDALRLKVKELKLKNEHNELKIKNLKKDIMMAEALELAKVSPAEEWLNSNKGYHYCSDPQKALLNTWLHAIWEAGQEYGAEKEIKRCSDIFRDYLAEVNWKGLENAEHPEIFNHESKEKPEIVGLLLCGSRTQPGRGKSEFVFQFDNSVTLDSGQKYKLTPIKD